MNGIELHGLRLHGYHGAEEWEREQGQTFLFDLWVELASPPGHDRLEETVDYREVAACVRQVSDGQKYHLLETLAAAVADEIRARFPVERVRVRVRKPEVQLDPPVEYSAAVVERP